MHARLSFIHVLSPLHAGTGQGSGIIDLPIAREKATNLPYLPGSSLKGTLKSHYTGANKEQIYGADKLDTYNEDHGASSVQISDQKLLLLPVRSLAGVFAWVTCPYVLHRLERDIKTTSVNATNNFSIAIPAISNEKCLVAKAVPNGGKAVKSAISMDVGQKKAVYLEDLDFPAAENADVTQWARWIGARIFPNSQEWQDLLVERICVVHDDLFAFLLETATEVTARIRLQEESKTVESGGLWYEEALPTETILWGLVLATPRGNTSLSPENIFDAVGRQSGQLLQFGGHATIGRGLCRFYLSAKR
jgi:CRISPR-associated protein Cmr4